MYFLTDIDPSAKTKGSRDALGTLGVWTGFARRVVGNLTTQTTSLDDFRVLVIGSWLEDQLAGKVAFPGDAFLVWEQLAAYARLEVLVDPPSFRGVTRANRRFGEKRMMLSPDPSDQLLGDQRTYGIWGLYRASSWRCRLTYADAPFVRGETLALVEQTYLPLLEAAWGPDAKELKAWARHGHDLRVPRDRAKLEAIAACISGDLRPAEADLYRDTLVFGGSTDSSVGSAQKELARHLQARVPVGERPSRDVVLAIAAATTVPHLGEALEDIVACESLLAPAVMGFSFLSRQDRTPLTEVAARLAEHFATAPTLLDATWLDRLRTVAAEGGRLVRAPGDPAEGVGRWIAIAEALNGKDFERLVRLLVEQNNAVSRERGASVGWVTIDAHDALQVNMADMSTDLQDPADVSSLWWNSYFLSGLTDFVHRLPKLAS